MEISTATFSLPLIIILILAIALASPLILSVHAKSKTRYAYSSISLTTNTGDGHGWVTNGNITQRRDIKLVGTFSLTISDGQGLMILVEGEIEIFFRHRIVNQKMTKHPDLRSVTQGTINMMVLLVDGEEATGSIGGSWVAGKGQPLKQVLTQGTGFFDGAKIEAFQTKSELNSGIWIRETEGTITGDFSSYLNSVCPT